MNRLLEHYYDEQEAAEEREYQERMAREDYDRPFPMPVPCVAGDISLTRDSYRTYGTGVAESVIAGNRDWLQFEPRTTAHVLETLFPRTMTAQISLDRMLVRVARALFDKGYLPSNPGPNPTWAFPV